MNIPDILLLLGVAIFFWGCAALVSPKVLFFAPLPMRTRARGFFFLVYAAFSVAMSGACIAVATEKPETWPVAIGVVIILFALLAFFWWALKRPPKPKQEQKTTPTKTTRPDKIEEPKNTEPDVVIDFPSMSGTGEVYRCNLTKLNCTCPDWHDRRKYLLRNDPGRLCKHLVQCFLKEPDKVPAKIKPFWKLIQLAGKNNRGMFAGNENVAAFYMVTESGEPYLITRKDNGEWVNLTTPDGERYGFSLYEFRWSYDNAPPQAEQWERRIRASKI